MKKFLILPLLAILAFSAAAQTFNVNAASSVSTWKGYKVTGQHTGVVKIKSGNVVFNNGVLTGGTIEIDMTSIKCTDLEGEYAGKLEGHLKSDDFFGVNSFPTAKLVVKRALAQDSKGNYKVIADLTIKGTTKEVKFFATANTSGNAATVHGKLTIDRSEYNVKYGSGSFFDGLGDKTIYDEFDVEVNLNASK